MKRNGRVTLNGHDIIVRASMVQDFFYISPGIGKVYDTFPRSGLGKLIESLFSRVRAKLSIRPAEIQ